MLDYFLRSRIRLGYDEIAGRNEQHRLSGLPRPPLVATIVPEHSDCNAN
jgi:hypothetical protein